MEKEPIILTLEHISNKSWLPSENDKEIMGEQSYNESVAEYNEEKAKLLYDNVVAIWDSCDCGDGYGCSHGSWIYELRFNDNPGATVTIEEWGKSSNWVFENKGVGDLVITVKGITNVQFEKCCEIVGINLIKKQPNTPELFKKPTDDELIKFAILLNDGRIDPEQLSSMVGMCNLIIDRLYENGDCMVPCLNENN